MPSDAMTVQDVNVALTIDIAKFYRKYRLPDFQPGFKVRDLFALALSAVEARNGRMLLAIDEYDRVARTAAQQKIMGDEAIALNGVLKGVLGVLKDNQRGHRLLMTGISTLHHSELTSTPNFIKTLSLDPRLATATGFLKEDIQAELERIFSGQFLPQDQLNDLLKDPRGGSPEALVRACLDFMEFYFNGYQFVPGHPRVFNPTQCLRFFETLTSQPVQCMNRVWNPEFGLLTEDEETNIFDIHTQVLCVCVCVCVLHKLLCYNVF